jgi:hypothetical protein
MGSEATKWFLYLDESGQFACDRDVAVGGVLANTDEIGATPSELRIALRAAAPELPWPLHNSLLNKPVLTAIGSFVQGATVRGAAGHTNTRILDSLSVSVVEFLNERAPELVRKVAAELRADRNPQWRDAAELDALLRQDESLYGHLRIRRQRIREAIAKVIGSLAQATGSSTGRGPHIFAIACGESDEVELAFTGEAVSPAKRAVVDATEAATSRYFGIHVALMERVVDLLLLQPGQHEVRVWWLSKDIHERVIDDSTPSHPRHIRSVIDRIAPDRLERVRFVPWSVSRYDENVDPLLVIADFVVSNACPLMGPFNQSLKIVERRLAQIVGVSLRGGGDGSSLAASGSTELFLSAWRSGHSSEPMPRAGKRLWAYEQAIEWSNIFERARAGSA